MRVKVAAMLALALFASSGATAQVCTIKAGVKSCPSDPKPTRTQDTTITNDQSSATKAGSTILFNDGTATILSGNAVFFNDGTSAIRYGNVTFFQDGRLCFRHDGVIFCN